MQEHGLGDGGLSGQGAAADIGDMHHRDGGFGLTILRRDADQADEDGDHQNTPTILRTPMVPMKAMRKMSSVSTGVMFMVWFFAA